MKTQRFFGATTREALARVKAALGEDAIILRNRKLDNGIEILATSDSDWADREDTGAAAAAAQAPRRAPAEAVASDTPSFIVAASVPRPPKMSTVSFQQYAQQRQRTARVPEGPAVPAPATQAPAAPARAAPASSVPAPDRPVAGTAPAGAALRPGGFGQDATVVANQRLVDEMRQMRSYISQQFSALSWVDGVRRSPGQANLLRRLLDAGFSPKLARVLVSRLPSDYDDDEALVWLHSALARNLRCDDWSQGLFADGGVIGLVGPTGVGKTTTTAKIAAHFALRHGVQSVGLVTIDGYRIAAQDQLRAFGELIGVTVLSAHDERALSRHLQTLSDRRLVLVDTAGVSQRDERVGPTLDSLDDHGVQRVLVLNAAAQEGTLEEVIDAYRAHEGAGVVLSKVDEAPRLGGAVDALVRHRLRIVGVADGQRVPEDWHEPDAAALVATALEPRVHDDFRLDDLELTMLMQRLDGGGETRSPAGGDAHA